MAFRVRFEDAEVDGEVHFLGGEDSFIQQVLCYPRAQCVEAEDRIEALKSDGFEYLIESGKNICGLRVLGRGYRAIVVLAYHKRHGLGSLKILRLDSTKSNLLEEVNMMNRAQPFQLPPKLYSYGDFYIFSELIPVQKCREFSKALQNLIKSSNEKELIKLLKRTTESLYKLDVAGISHMEINRPDGHIFCCREDLKIVDWGSARLTKKPSNLTSLVSFLLFRFELSNDLGRILGFNKEKVVDAMREYKRSYNIEEFRKVLAALHLDETS